MKPLLIKMDGKFYSFTKSEQEVEEPYLSYVLGNNGIFLYNKNNAHSVIKFVGDNIKNVDKIEEKFEWSYPPISFEVYSKVLTFFREVYKKYKSESCALLTLNRGLPLEKQSYKIRIPKQKISYTSVNYTEGLKELSSSFGKDEFLAGSIHSHPNFGAFQSGGDAEDEINFDGIHITLGNIERSVPEIHARLCLTGKCYEIKEINSVLSIVPKVEDIDIDKEWIDKIDKPACDNMFDYYPGYNYSKNFCSNRNKEPKIKELFKAMKPKEPLNQRSDTSLQTIETQEYATETK